MRRPFRRLKRGVKALPGMGRAGLGLIKVLPAYLISAAEQELSTSQLVRLLDPRNSQVAATPIVSYADWVERNEKSGLFDGYPTSPEYQRPLKTYPSKVDRIHLVASFLQATRDVPGDVAEFGVFRGHTAIILNQIRRGWSNGKRLHLFDSFQGLPATVRDDDEFVPGQFSDTTVGLVRNVVASDQVNVVRGFFRDTFPTVPDLRFSFCHVDCDLEVSVLECLDYILPRLSVGGIVVFDDYGFRACSGLRQAVDRFFASRTQTVISLPTSQAVYFKTRLGGFHGEIKTIPL